MKSEVVQSHHETSENASACEEKESNKIQNTTSKAEQDDHFESDSVIESEVSNRRNPPDDYNFLSQTENASFSKVREALEWDEDRLVSNLVDEYNTAEHRGSIGSYIVKTIGDDDNTRQSFSFIRDNNSDGTLMNWITKNTGSFMASLATELGDETSPNDSILDQEKKYLSDLLTREFIGTDVVSSKQQREKL